MKPASAPWTGIYLPEALLTRYTGVFPKDIRTADVRRKTARGDAGEEVEFFSLEDVSPKNPMGFNPPMSVRLAIAKAAWAAEKILQGSSWSYPGAVTDQEEWVDAARFVELLGLPPVRFRRLYGDTEAPIRVRGKTNRGRVYCRSDLEGLRERFRRELVQPRPEEWAGLQVPAPEFAFFLQIHISRVYRLVRRGQLLATKTRSGNLLINLGAALGGGGRRVVGSASEAMKKIAQGFGAAPTPEPQKAATGARASLQNRSGGEADQIRLLNQLVRDGHIKLSPKSHLKVIEAILSGAREATS